MLYQYPSRQSSERSPVKISGLSTVVNDVDRRNVDSGEWNLHGVLGSDHRPERSLEE